MTSPIEIPDLDPAGPVDYTNDQMLIRQGLNDKRVSPGQLTNVRLETFGTLNSPIVTTDVILIGRNAGGGTYTNLITDPRRLGFLNNVTMWFYSNSAPLYWTNQPALADRLLAVKGGSLSYKNQGLQGQWQQLDVGGVTGKGLTIRQMPNHNHYAQFGQGQSNEDATYIHGAKNVQSGGDPRFGTSPKTDPVRGVVGGKSDNSNHDNYGNSDPHNHGNNWRPLAAVGLVCAKTG